MEICEHPELKKRIIELLNELEIKNSNRFLRSKKCHLQNTRSWSVRRTSLTAKSNISRRDAQEEVKLWIDASQKNDENDPIQKHNLTNNQNNCIDRK